jgi:V8-like Glu-specific endopeptidase
MRRSLGVVVVVAAALLAGLPVVAPALAEPAPAQPVQPGPVRDGAVVQDLVNPAGAAYWNRRRMREALPLDLDPGGAVIASDADAGAAGAPQAAGTPPGLRSTGKLFFRDPKTSQGYVCSASSVNTPEHNLVVTAGHCVYSTRDGCVLLCTARHYFSDFVFVPSYDHGTAPYGQWTGVRAITQQAWIADEDDGHDQAFLAVAPVGAANLVDVVGGNGLAWNYPAREDGVRVVGWPAQAPYDGQSRQECAGSTTVSQVTAPTDAQISCPLTGGASGGPWFLRMASADTGFIFAVTSRRPADGTPLLFAMPFDSSIETLLAAARGAAGPFTARVAARPGGKPRLRLVATAASVGFGETYQLVAETRRVRRIVLQVRSAPGAPWQRVARARVREGVTVFAQALPPGTRWYRIRERGSRRHSRQVAVTVGACPLPLDRSPSVVSNTRCTSPVG